MNPISRRTAIKAAGLAAAAMALNGLPRSLQAQERAVRKRTIRGAHLTDLHIQPELKAGVGVASCLRHVRDQADKPSLILIGGDMVMDSFESDDARTKQQWDLFT